MQPLRCFNCGASIAVPAHPGAIAACAYCNTTFRVPTTPTPEPDLGDLMLGTDFTSLEQPGWLTRVDMRYSLRQGEVPELVVRDAEKKRMTRNFLSTPAPFDDFDVGFTFRRLEALPEAQVGFFIRHSSDGCYHVLLASTQFVVYFMDPSHKIDFIAPWAGHNAIRREPGAPNRLRVLAVGDRLRVYINGVLAASLRDARRRAGCIHLVVSPQGADIELAVSDLALREPPRP